MNRRSTRRITLIAVAAIVPSLVLGVFIGALAAADKGHATIPAAIVDQDRLVTTTQGGKSTIIAAGRLVVTNLTKPATGGAGAAIDWRLASASEASSMLRAGDVYAVVTIPEDFSKSISSVSTTDPDRARITIRTDDAHGYVVSQLAGGLGTSLTATLGSTISTSVIKGLYSGFATLHDQLGSAATGAAKLGSGGTALAGGLGRIATGQDGIANGAASLGTGAQRLADGSDSLAAGLTKAAGGASSASSGVSSLATGIRQYRDGVTGGLRTAASRAAGLQQLPGGFRAYAAGVGQAAGGIGAILAADPSIDARSRAALQQVQAGLETAASGSGERQLLAGTEGAAQFQQAVAALGSRSGQLAAGGTTLADGADRAASGIGTLAHGLTASASGAAKLGAGDVQLGTGADALATGAAKIAAGVRQSQSGAAKLGSGATSLGAGLSKAVAALPDTTAAERTRIADVVANPVQATSVRDHETTSIGSIVAALILPVSLWIGAAGAVLLFGAIRRRLLTTGIGTARLVGASLGRGSVLAAGQAVLLIVLVQATLHLDWGRAFTALLVALVAGVAFFAVHQLLTALAGRAGTVISILLLGAQLVAVGGLYPIELVSAPFQAISPYLPLTAAVSAMQAIVTGAYGAAVAGGVATLALYALLGYVATTAVVARRRSSAALFAPPPQAARPA